MDTPHFFTDDTDIDEEFDAIVFAFMDEWEAGDATGECPTLREYVRRYPRHANALTDFVLGYVRMKANSDSVSYEGDLSPEAVRAGERVRETLGLSQYTTVDV